jgi:glycosyltransferase involved in cell wall biosynthesis
VNVSAVIPCFRVGDKVLDVIARIGPEVTRIIVVDDNCPLTTGAIVAARCKDARVQVVVQAVNTGVGGATKAGIAKALEESPDVIVKLDGDGQMPPELIPKLIAPIAAGTSDCVKGNRFFRLEDTRRMPLLRLVGNAGLSFMSKLSTGYWSLFDPTNGFIALHAAVAKVLPWEKIADRYFFESDLLFRLGTLQAVVTDLPMTAVYGNETSSLQPLPELFRFGLGHLKNLLKRIFYVYFLRDFNVASLELLVGVAGMTFGFTFGVLNWRTHGEPATAGTVMLAALPFLIGAQSIIGFLNYDMRAGRTAPLHKQLEP